MCSEHSSWISLQSWGRVTVSPGALLLVVVAHGSETKSRQPSPSSPAGGKLRCFLSWEPESRTECYGALEVEFLASSIFLLKIFIYLTEPEPVPNVSNQQPWPDTQEKVVQVICNTLTHFCRLPPKGVPVYYFSS